MGTARRDAGFRFEVRDDIESEPVREIAEALVVRDEAHAAQILGLLFPRIGCCFPACEEFIEILAVRDGVPRIEFREPVRQCFCYALDVAGMQVDVRIALRVHVTL